MKIVAYNPPTKHLEKSYLGRSYAAGTTSFLVKNSDRFVAGQRILLGEMGRERAEILTVEGLEKTAGGKILQQAYVERGAAQCGFCIPGMLIASYAFLAGKPEVTEQAIRDAHGGNICRCTGYAKIIEAIQLAAERWPAKP